jgi:hypothetical protein
VAGGHGAKCAFAYPYGCYLIFKAKTRGFAHERLRIAIDDYAGEITGDRTALHAKPASIGH